jgi:hypothetical protein
MSGKYESQEMKSTIYRGVTPHSSDRAQHFEKTCDLHLQGGTVSQTGNQVGLPPTSDGFLYGPEEAGDTFLGSFGLSLYYMVSEHRRLYLS